jgi:proteic killer suppression protein
MLAGLKGALSAIVWTGSVGKGFPPDLVRPAQRKLVMIAAATTLDVLRQPPGNRLEALKGDRAGQHGVRINDQWRICFVWRDGAAHDVEFVDHHR